MRRGAGGRRSAVVENGVGQDHGDVFDRHLFFRPQFAHSVGRHRPGHRRDAGGGRHFPSLSTISRGSSGLPVALAGQTEVAARDARGDGDDELSDLHGPRLLEMMRVLKPTGSIYLHCDPTESHGLKLMMDAIFGRGNFRNEIAWRKYSGRKSNAKRKFPTQQDIILFYSKSDDALFNPVYETMSDREIEKKYKYVDDDGRRYRLAWGRQYQVKGEQRRIYLNEQPGAMVGTLWVENGLQLNTSSSERTGYPTQKPLALLERVIKASTNPGDVVLDPFCGCATAAIASEKLKRKWVGIDLSPKAFELVSSRLENQLGLPDLSPIHRKDQPERTDLGDLPKPRTHLKDLWWEQKGYCNGCGHYFEPSGHDVDHIVPTIKGGTDHVSNLQLLCGGCNSTKGDRPMSYLTAKKLNERGVTYGGKVTEIVEETEARQAAEASEAVPAGLKEALAAAGLDPSKAGGLLTELAKALADQGRPS